MIGVGSRIRIVLSTTVLPIGIRQCHFSSGLSEITDRPVSPTPWSMKAREAPPSDHGVIERNLVDSAGQNVPPPGGRASSRVTCGTTGDPWSANRLRDSDLRAGVL